MSMHSIKNNAAPCCVNHLDNGYLADQNIFDGNTLNLLPEQSHEIYRKCLSFLATCQLSSRCARIFCATLEQTIGFGKLEDNINSSRLENLTKIRHDHAIAALRELDHKNVIIHRHGGKFRNWISINFNFESWGVGDKNRQARSNDPRLLISDKYAGQAVDQGVDLGSSEPIETAFENTLTEAIDQGRDLNIQTEIKPESKPTPNTEKFENAFLSALSSIEEKFTHQLHGVVSQLEDIREKIKTPSVDNSINHKPNNSPVETNPVQPSQAQQASISENSVKAIPAAIEQSIQTLSSQPDSIHNYSFPMQLSHADCVEMHRTLLPQTGDKGQLMLKLLNKRLGNTADPIKNPMAYFASLVAKFKRGTLDLYAIEQEEAKEIEAQYQVLDRELQRIKTERQGYCDQVDAEMKKKGLDDSVIPDFIKIAKQMQLADLIRNIEIRVNEINSDPIVIKRNAMAA